MFRLMIKTSNIGLKYLCISKRDDYDLYKGSGRTWIEHLNEVGDDITTQVLFETESHEELSKAGLYYSNLFNIVLSEEWDNLVKEEGYKSFNKFNHWSLSDNDIPDRISTAQTKMFNGMTNEEKIEYTSKLRSGRKIWFDSMSKEELDIYSEKLRVSRKNYLDNMTCDQKYKLSKNIRAARLNMPEENKKSRKNKIQAVYATGKHTELFDRYSKERQGSENPAAVRVSIDGVIYNCIKDAVTELGITRSIINRRLKSEKYPTYIKI